MKQFYKIIFNKKFTEDFLVDLICSILKNIDKHEYFFFLDNVLIDDNKYYFIFGGDMKYTKILVRNIKKYVKIQNHKFCY